MRRFEITEEALLKTFDYLRRKPYGEVSELITVIQDAITEVRTEEEQPEGIMADVEEGPKEEGPVRPKSK